MSNTKHVFALFEDLDHALGAYREVEAGGCSSDHCSAILHQRHLEDSRSPAGARASGQAAKRGAVVLGSVGAVLGGAVAIGGGIVAIGPLAAAALGAGVMAAYGALIGGISGADEPEKHLRALQGEIENGKIVIALQTDDPALEAMCHAVFQRHGGVEVSV